MRGPVGRWGQWQGPHPSALLPDSTDEVFAGWWPWGGRKADRETEVTGQHGLGLVRSPPAPLPALGCPSSGPWSVLASLGPSGGVQDPAGLRRGLLLLPGSGPQCGPHCDASGGERRKIGVGQPASVAPVKAPSWSRVLPCAPCTPPPRPKDQARNFRSPHFCCCCRPRRSQEPTLGLRWAEAVPAGREGASTGWPQGQLPKSPQAQGGARWLRGGVTMA